MEGMDKDNGFMMVARVRDGNLYICHVLVRTTMTAKIEICYNEAFVALAPNNSTGSKPVRPWQRSV